ncbi:hypothetical protein V2J09_002102 [Rumex salicifolius]
MRIPKIKFPSRLPKLSPTGSESKAAESVASNTRILSSDVPRPPSSTGIGGNASLQPKRTPVSDQEIDAIMAPYKEMTDSFGVECYSNWFILIASMVALIIIGMYIFICYDHNGYRTRREEEMTSIDVTGFQARLLLDDIRIRSYPTLIIGESFREVESDNKMCSICLADYEAKEILKILPDCLHRFHANCIDQWLRFHSSCPICRIYLS